MRSAVQSIPSFRRRQWRMGTLFNKVDAAIFSWQDDFLWGVNCPQLQQTEGFFSRISSLFICYDDVLNRLFLRRWQKVSGMFSLTFFISIYCLQVIYIPSVWDLDKAKWPFVSTMMPAVSMPLLVYLAFFFIFVNADSTDQVWIKILKARQVINYACFFFTAEIRHGRCHITILVVSSVVVRQHKRISAPLVLCKFFSY